MPLSERAVEQKILVAVDFGTTFSSVAWEQTGEAGAQNVIQLWPDEHSTDQDFHGNTTDKVPTTLSADLDDPKWGYQIENQEKRYEWFKLHLDPSIRNERSQLWKKYPGTRRLSTSSSLDSLASAQSLTTTYLHALQIHVKQMLERSILKAVLRRTRLEYIITVPAVWSEKARALTVKCAAEAGMGSEHQLRVVSEPEAAAIYSISKFRQINSGGLDVGDTFVLCDAGGGTVDLISYTIKTLDPVLELEEAAEGTGDACGSTFLNRIFAKVLNDRFKYDWNWKNDPEILNMAMEHFEKETKVRFNGKKGDTIPVAGVESGPGIKRHRLELSNEEMKEMFEPVISEVLSLIRCQIEQTTQDIKFILLVGGFGNSVYLQSRIQEEFGAITEVKVSPECQTAVVRGALMKGLSDIRGQKSKLPRVRARMARKNYGTECVTPYKARHRSSNEGHSPERRKLNTFTGGYDVEVMKWFLQKEQLIEENKPAVFPFSTDFRVNTGRPQKISIDIFCHSDPMRMGPPQYKTIDVVKLGTVTADIHDLHHSLLERQRGGDGDEYYVMNFDIEMKCLAAKIEFTPIYIHQNGVIRFPPAVVDYE